MSNILTDVGSRGRYYYVGNVEEEEEDNDDGNDEVEKEREVESKDANLGNESNANVMENDEQDMYTALVNSNVVLIVIL